MLIVADDPEEMLERLSLPELQWLGRVIREGEMFDHLTWCEKRLEIKGLVAHVEYRRRKKDGTTYCVWSGREATSFGKRVYELARERWRERHAHAPSAGEEK